MQRGPYSILAFGLSLKAFSALFCAQPVVEIPKISAFTFGGPLHLHILSLNFGSVYLAQSVLGWFPHDAEFLENSK